MAQSGIGCGAMQVKNKRLKRSNLTSSKAETAPSGPLLPCMQGEKEAAKILPDFLLKKK
jgi:hypothetical protein